MDEAGVVADMVGDRGEKGDHVMLYHRLYLIDARNIEVRPGLDPLHGVSGDGPHLRMGLAGVDLYLEPFAIPVFRFPYKDYTRNHETLCMSLF